MSIRRKLSQLQTKPLQISFRIWGALLDEFGRGEIKSIGQAFKSQKVLDGVTSICNTMYTPAITKEERDINSKAGTEFIHLIERQIKRHEYSRL
jgi:hypothetical protein